MLSQNTSHRTNDASPKILNQLGCCSLMMEGIRKGDILKKSILIGLLVLLSAVSVRADYIAEIDAVYSDVEDSDDGYEEYVVSGTIFFGSVDTSKGPLAEASFLDKSSSISAIFEDYDGTEHKGLGGRFVIGNEYVVEAKYLESEEEIFQSDTVSQTQASVAVGKYLTDTSELALSYEQYELDYELDDFADSFPDFAASFDSENKTKILGVRYHGVSGAHRSGFLSYEGGAYYIDYEGIEGSAEAVYGRLTYYPRPSFGIGGRVSAVISEIDDPDYVDEDVLGIGADVSYFFVEGFAAYLAVQHYVYYEDGFDESSDYDQTTLSVGLKVRF